jgi:hypothetical protein
MRMPLMPLTPAPIIFTVKELCDELEWWGPAIAVLEMAATFLGKGEAAAVLASTCANHGKKAKGCQRRGCGRYGDQVRQRFLQLVYCECSRALVCACVRLFLGSWQCNAAQYPSALFFKEYKVIILEVHETLTGSAGSSQKREHWLEFSAAVTDHVFWADVEVIEYVMQPFWKAIKFAQGSDKTLSDQFVAFHQFVNDIARLETKAVTYPANGKPRIRGRHVENIIHSINVVCAMRQHPLRARDAALYERDLQREDKQLWNELMTIAVTFDPRFNPAAPRGTWRPEGAPTLEQWTDCAVLCGDIFKEHYLRLGLTAADVPVVLAILASAAYVARRDALAQRVVLRRALAEIGTGS